MRRRKQLLPLAMSLLVMFFYTTEARAQDSIKAAMRKVHKEASESTKARSEAEKKIASSLWQTMYFAIAADSSELLRKGFQVQFQQMKMKGRMDDQGRLEIRLKLKSSKDTTAIRQKLLSHDEEIIYVSRFGTIICRANPRYIRSLARDPSILTITVPGEIVYQTGYVTSAGDIELLADQARLRYGGRETGQEAAYSGVQGEGHARASGGRGESGRSGGEVPGAYQLALLVEEAAL